MEFSQPTYSIALCTRAVKEDEESMLGFYKRETLLPYPVCLSGEGLVVGVIVMGPLRQPAFSFTRLLFSP
jgi:hypothetical protein